MDLSEKELLLLDAYRTASSIEKHRVENILKIQEQAELKKLEEMEWSEKSTGGRLMKLLRMEKEEVRRVSRSLDFRQFEVISEALVSDSEESLQKVKEIFGCY